MTHSLFSLQLQALPNAVARAQAEADGCQQPTAKPVHAIAARIETNRRHTSELREAALTYISNNGPVAGSKVGSALGFNSNQGVLPHLHTLAAQGLIRQTGTRKGSKWEIMK